MTNYIHADTDRKFLFKTCLAGMFVWLALFSGFFHNWKGAEDFFVALAPWLKTGVSGAGHNKPFSHWLLLFRQYEWVGVVGIAGAFIGVVSRSWKLRFLSFLALVNGLIYSWIPYKTPWCIISMLWPFVFVAGIWMEFIVAKFSARYRPAFLSSIAVAAVLAGRSVVAAYTLNFVHYADPSPYVYVQVKNDFKILDTIIQKKIRLAPDFQNMIVQANLNESWPLPWYFSRFPNGRFSGPQEGFDLKSDIIFSEVFRSGQLLSDLYVRRRIDLREAREPMYVYLKKSTFQGIDLPGFGPFRTGEQGS